MHGFKKYKMCIRDRYYVAVWDENNNLKDLYGVGENPVNDPKLIVPNSGEDNSPQTISVTGLEAGRSYKISFYGTTDLSNKEKINRHSPYLSITLPK